MSEGGLLVIEEGDYVLFEGAVSFAELVSDIHFLYRFHGNVFFEESNFKQPLITCSRRYLRL